MAAVILENEDLNNERFDSLEGMDEGTTLGAQESIEQDNPVPQASPESQVPDKYSGKSLEDVVRMHQEAEKLLGRQSSEVGDLRNVVDSYINTQLNDQRPTQATDTDEDIDFYSDPEKAMSRAIDNHPSVRAAEQSTRAYHQQTSMARLKEGHPDMQEIVTDPRFSEWIQASNIRTKMFVAADQHFDVEAANELFSLWKDRSGAIKQTLQAEKDGRQKAVKEGSTGYTRGNPDSSTSKKIYRRADIIKLMKTDPERYLALSDDITKAYAEKRVK
tara:strand:- start:26 stop:847 length:822 start_codon:yes stop_codon:yes gene_type:complete